MWPGAMVDDLAAKIPSEDPYIRIAAQMASAAGEDEMTITAAGATALAAKIGALAGELPHFALMGIDIGAATTND
jgi:phosphoribosyl-dephospho-CoA transferase